MKRRIVCFCMVIMMLVLALGACGKAKNEEPEIKPENAVNAVDFSEYTADDVIAWAIENDVLSKFSFAYEVADGTTPGNVIGQSVKSGEPITDRIVITISEKIVLGGSMPISSEVSGNPVANIKVPDVLGLTYIDARAKLMAAGFDFDSKYENSIVEKDRVICSDPLPGSAAPLRSTVMLTLSTGRSGSSSNQMTIDLDCSEFGEIEKNIKVYIDGELDLSKKTVLGPSETHKVFSFTGTGTINVRFKVNNELFKTYEINFEKGIINTIA